MKRIADSEACDLVGDLPEDNLNKVRELSSGPQARCCACDGPGVGPCSKALAAGECSAASDSDPEARVDAAVAFAPWLWARAVLLALVLKDTMA